MERTYVEDKTFEKINFIEKPFSKGDYEGCSFINCDFSNTDLSNINFSECSFIGCNLSMAKLIKTAMQEIVFRDCKLLGLRFDDCSDFLFAVQFDNCTLNLTSFFKRRLKNTNFKNSVLQEVDFAEADLSGSVFENCDLTGALFENTNLEKADLRTAHHYIIDPELNKIEKAKFAITGIVGLLAKYNIFIE